MGAWEVAQGQHRVVRDLSVAPGDLVALWVNLRESSRWIKEALSSSGFSLLEAEDGYQGVRLAAYHQPSIAILPEPPSWANLYRLIQDLKIVADPAVLVAGSGEPGRLELALESGADLYIDPSMTPRELAARIRSILRRHHRVEAPRRLRPPAGSDY